MRAVSLLLACLLGLSLAHIENPLSEFRVDKVHKLEEANDIAITATPDLLNSTGWVTIRYSGVTKPNPAKDFIAVYSPANTDPTITIPIKYRFIDPADTNTTSNKKGEVTFRLLNMRADYVFAFYRGGVKNPALAAISNVVRFTNYNQPQSVSLGLTGKAGEIRVSWTTRDREQPMVVYGLQSSRYSQIAYANTTTYKKEELCGGPANTIGWRDPGSIHHAVISNLQPGVRYFYRVGDTFGMSEESSFTAPVTANSLLNYTFVIFGDMGQLEADYPESMVKVEPGARNTTAAVLKELDSSYPEFVLHNGDISYANGFLFQWDTFGEQISPIASRIPWLITVGNHESDWPSSGSYFEGLDSGGECGVPALRRYPMPVTGDNPKQPWYSYEYGPVHFLAMSTEHDFNIALPQYQWIVQDLAKVNRTRTPWVIAVGHRPMYVSSSDYKVPNGEQTVAILMRKVLEDVFIKYQVDAAFWGHHHSYQRTCQVYAEKCVSADPATGYAAPVHIVSGAAGAKFTKSVLDPTPEYISYFNNQQFGYTRATVTRHSLRFEFMSAPDRHVLDEVTIPLPHSRRAAL